MDKQKFHSAIKVLFEAKMKPCTGETVAAWYELLKSYDEDLVITAMLDLARSPDQFFNVGMVIERLRPNDTAEAEMAWNEAYSSAQAAGRLPISARTARALNNIGGMMKLRDCPIDDLHWLRKEFIDAYLNLRNYTAPVKECYGLTGGIIEGQKEIEVAPEIKQLLDKVGQRI